jgi:drug/metabolite transporter (DMT)-like permease
MATAWLGERLTARRLFGIGLAVAGVLLIVARGAPDAGARDPVAGNLLMFAGVVFWGAYTMWAKRIAEADVVAVTACVAAMGTLLLLPAALAEAALRPTPVLRLADGLRIGYLGVFPSALCYLLFNRALRDLEASQVGVFINLIPVIGVASGVWLLGETMTPLALAGGMLVFTGVWISARTSATAGAVDR